MKNCLNCKHTEETIFEDCMKCVNEKSEYYEELVDERDLCLYWEGDKWPGMQK